VTFEVLTAKVVKIQVSCNVTPHWLVTIILRE